MILVWGIREHVAVTIAAIATASGEVVTADHVETAGMGPEDEVFSAGVAHSSAGVALLEVVEDDVGEVGLAVEDWLLADHVEP